MINFKVELKDKTLSVMADRACIVEGVLNLYNIRVVPVCIGGGFTIEEKDIVGSFAEYKSFYIDGDMK